MGRVVTFDELQTQSPTGVGTAPITGSDMREMAAELVRIAPGKQWSGKVPRGSDCYLFVLSGNVALSVANARHAMRPQSFATLQEDTEFAVAAEGGAAEVVKVIAPPQPNGRNHAGFAGDVSVIARDQAPVVDIPNEKKRRLYFVSDHAAKSERGHAMIVIYQRDTVTPLHHHPDAESMFVPLDGALEFTVNGAPVTVKPGQAAYFGTHDKHGLHTATGHGGASFLEFHIPAAFTTVKE